jgi:hypothetical protein
VSRAGGHPEDQAILFHQTRLWTVLLQGFQRLTEAALRKAILAIWCVAFCGMQ